MFRATIVLLVVLLGVNTSALWPSSSLQLKSTKTWQQRFRYEELLNCHENVLTTDYQYTAFESIAQPSSTFRFYTVAEQQIQFRLTVAPVSQNNLYSVDYVQFVIAANQITIENSIGTKSSNIIKSLKPLIYIKELNEVKVRLGEKDTLTILINGVQFNTVNGLKSVGESFRYVSFITSSTMNAQEFIYGCESPRKVVQPSRAVKPIESGDKKPVILPGTGDKKPVQPTEPSNNKPSKPIELDTKKPTQSTEVKKPSKPLGTDSQKPVKPAATGDRILSKLTEGDTKKPSQSSGPVDKKPSSGAGADNQKPPGVEKPPKSTSSGNQNPNTSNDSVAKKPSSPTEAAKKKPAKPTEVDDKRPSKNTESDNQVPDQSTRPGDGKLLKPTGSTEKQTKPSTPAESGDKKKPVKPEGSDDKKSLQTGEADSKKPVKPAGSMDDENKKPMKPTGGSGDKKPSKPSDSGNKKPTKPTGSDDKKPTTSTASGGKKPSKSSEVVENNPTNSVGKIEHIQLKTPTEPEPNDVADSDDEMAELYRYLNLNPEDKDLLNEQIKQTYGKQTDEN